MDMKMKEPYEDPYQVKAAYEDVMRAHEHKKNPKMWEAIQNHAKDESEAIMSIADLRGKAEEKAKEAASEEKKVKPRAPIPSDEPGKVFPGDKAEAKSDNKDREPLVKPKSAPDAVKGGGRPKMAKKGSPKSVAELRKMAGHQGGY